MKVAVATLRSISPYSQSRPVLSPREDKESPSDHEKRTWRERIHRTEDGRVFIPPMAFKKSLEEAASYLSIKIPGKRNATWSKHFLAGVLVLDGPLLDLRVEDIEGEWLYLNADGKRNSGTRVWRCMPVIREWRAAVTYHVLDDTITEDAFVSHLREAGKFIGIGRFRPRNGGFYGRYDVEAIQWMPAEERAAA